MMRCCEGETYVRPDGPRYDEPGIGVASKVPMGSRILWVATHLNGYQDRPSPESWAVCCFDCGAVLAVVDGPREEVYALL